MLQQLKTLSESRDLMQREFQELKDAAQDVAGLMEIPEGNEDKPLPLQGSFEKYPRALKGSSPQPPDNTWDMYSGW